MGNFKDFDLDLKVNKGDGKQGNGDPLAWTALCTYDAICHSILECATFGCESFSCASCHCSLSDMTMCRQIPQEKNDMRRC